MILPNKSKLIGIDLGGTKINAGLIEGMNIIDKRYSLIPTNATDAQELINIFIDLISELIDKSVVGIGIGIPSLVDRENGIIHSVQNIPSWINIHLADILEKKFQVPIYLDNDANCFALGEYRFGVGQNFKNFVGLTLGTGMGSGIISNGYLLPDANCGSGEFGSIPYLDGIYEDYCSGKFFKTHYKQDGANILKNAINGDKQAIEAFQVFGFHLGNAIKTIMFSVDPPQIIIGGSVANSKSYFLKSLNESISKFPYQESVEKLDIIFSNTQDIAIFGAASLYFDRHKNGNIL